MSWLCEIVPLLELNGCLRAASTEIGARQARVFQRFGNRCKGGFSICSRVTQRAVVSARKGCPFEELRMTLALQRALGPPGVVTKEN